MTKLVSRFYEGGVPKTQAEAEKILSDEGYKKNTLAYTRNMRTLLSTGKTEGNYDDKKEKATLAKRNENATAKATAQKEKKARQENWNAKSKDDQIKYLDQLISDFDNNKDIDINRAKEVQRILVDNGYDIGFLDKATQKKRTGEAAIDGRIGKSTYKKIKELRSQINLDNEAKDTPAVEAPKVAGYSNQQNKDIARSYYEFYKNNPNQEIAPYARAFMSDEMLNDLGRGKKQEEAAQLAEIREDIARGQANAANTFSYPARVVGNGVGYVAQQGTNFLSNYAPWLLDAGNYVLGNTLGFNLKPQEVYLEDVFHPGWQEKGRTNINASGKDVKDHQIFDTITDADTPTIGRRIYEGMKTYEFGKEGSFLEGASRDDITPLVFWDDPRVKGIGNALVMEGIMNAPFMKGQKTSAMRSTKQTGNKTVQKGARTGVRMVDGEVEGIVAPGRGEVEGMGIQRQSAQEVMSNGKMPETKQTSKNMSNANQNRRAPSKRMKDIDKITKEYFPNDKFAEVETTQGTLRGGDRVYANRDVRGHWTYNPLAYRYSEWIPLNRTMRLHPVVPVRQEYVTPEPKRTYTPEYYNYEYLNGPGGEGYMTVKTADGNVAYVGKTANTPYRWGGDASTGLIPRYYGDGTEVKKKGGTLIKRK